MTRLSIAMVSTVTEPSAVCTRPRRTMPNQDSGGGGSYFIRRYDDMRTAAVKAMRRAQPADWNASSAAVAMAGRPADDAKNGCPWEGKKAGGTGAGGIVWVARGASYFWESRPDRGAPAPPPAG